MGEPIVTLVLALTEDAGIESFEERKTALRDQVRATGGLAVTVFAADKLSDIVGLRRGIDRYGQGIEERMGTTVSSMAGHYRESVELIESAQARLGIPAAAARRIGPTRRRSARCVARPARVPDGDGGNRTRVRGRDAKASTGIAGALVSSSGSAPAGESGRPVP